nr:MAG TPA: Protein of unknown function (DUF1642) [Caudoviricetes sp.]
MNIQELIKKYEEKYETVFGFPVIQLNQILEDLKQLDEPQKVTVPQFVADWIEYCKRHNFTLFGCLDPVDNFEVLVGEDFEGDARKCILWCRSASDKVARAWLDGYEVEEKRYLVKLKGIHSESEYLYYGMGSCKWRVKGKNESGSFRKNHTRKELEEAGFGWVFDCSGIEIEEVE